MGHWHHHRGQSFRCRVDELSINLAGKDFLLFGTKGFFAPATGFRLFLGDRFHLRAEVRGNFWKLSYPASFRSGTEPVTADAKEWNLAPWFAVGMGLIL